MAGLRGLNGSTIIVTGAASGIGLATATRLAEEGAIVAIFDLDSDGGSQAANGLVEAWPTHAGIVEVENGGGPIGPIALVLAQ